MKNINIFVVGQTSSGKSATANSLLGRQIFPESNSLCIQRKPFFNGQFAYRELQMSENGNDEVYMLTVMDAVGFEAMSNIEDEMTFRLNVKTFLEICKQGIDAVLYCIKYSGGYGAVDIDSFNRMQHVLGNILGHLFIVVVTCGDYFHEIEKQLEFPVWCNNQEGPFGQLMRACNNRCVLINNREANIYRIEQQTKDIILLAETIASVQPKLSLSFFHRHCLPTHEDITTICTNLEKDLSPYDCIDHFLSEKCKKQIELLKYLIESKEEWTGQLNSFRSLLISFQTNIGNIKVRE